MATHSIDGEIAAAIASPEDLGGIVGASKFILNRLKEAGLAREVVLPPSHLGLHPCNRGKYGAHEDSVHTLATEIFQVGWDSEKLRGAICVEEGPDGYIEAYNRSLTMSSDLLAPVEKNTIVAGTLTNGHTVLMLRALVAGVKSSAAGVCIDGHMNLAAVTASRPEMGRAAIEGWRWTMLKHACKDLYGDPLFELLSGVHNLQLSKAEHELEVLLKVWRQATKYTKEGKAIDWADILKSILRTQPECTGYVSPMVKFVQLFGGGSECTCIPDLCRFHRRHVAGKRIVAFLFDFLANASFAVKGDVKTQGMLLRYAILKAAYTGPEDKVVGKASVFVTKSDIDALSRKHLSNVVVAEAILSKCRSIAIGLGSALSDDQLAKAYGLLDVNVARVLMNKQQTSTVKYASIESVASAFCKELQAMTGRILDNPWAKAEPTEDPASKLAETRTTIGMRQFTAEGALVDEDPCEILVAAGFKVGMEVVMKSDKKHDKYTLTAVEGKSVHLSDGRTRTKHVHLVETFVASWKPYVEEFFSMDDTNTSNANVMYAIATHKAAVAFAIGQMSRSLQRAPVAVMAKPVKKVIAAERIPSGGLCLLPETLNISAIDADKDPPSGGLVVEISNFELATICLLPQPMSAGDKKVPFTSPLWAVAKTDDPGEANVEWAQLSWEVSAAANKGGSQKPTIKTIKMKVWALVNKRVIAEGAEIRVLNDEYEDEEPEPKKQRK